MIVKNISTAFVILSFIFIIAFNAGLKPFIDIQSLWFVVIPIVFLLWVGTRRKEKMTELIKGRGISWLELIGYVSVLLGVIGSHMGMVSLFGNLEDKTSYGPSFAVLTLTSFYGIFIFLMSFLLGQHKLKKVSLFFVLGQVLILINAILVMALNL